MGSANANGEITLVEAAGRPPTLLPVAAAHVLGHADRVLAPRGTHPNVLALAHPEAVHSDETLPSAIAHARTGSAVVVVVDHATEAMQREARASGVQVKVVPGVSTDQVLPPAGPLAGCRVLVTRPQPAASTQRDAFVQRGADAVALPCLQPEPPEDLAAFDHAVANARSHDGLIVSSPIGVQALFDSLARTGLDARLLADRAIAVVGKATATALTHRGLRPDIVATTQRSEGIVSAIEDAGRLAQRWLHVRARDGRDTVRAAISSAGGTFTLAVAYRTTCPEPPPGVLSWLGHGVDAVCLHSGRTAEHLLALAQTHGFVHVLKEAAVFSAGPITTKALQEQGFEVRATAASPGDAGMLDVVCEGFRATS